ncbi:disulfide bond formation protein DsbB [Methylovorus sp. MM2]|uniref:disulfide bond formation protein B n=1 Tax=Methylovorus sp. MM2 TaxID=1848038 RepID=UPI0007E1B3A7|nr:disulfide bond formation protein B [Methylovorus sp. MM2]OAM53326.1 disulfide bond formation protein DsbB [Methylovorus sp. MM2]
MLNKLFGKRTGYLLGFIVSFGLVGMALYIQQKYNLEPCPLCISQRIAFMVLGLLFLGAAIHGPKGWGRNVYGLLHFTAAAAGAGIASRHIWIQANPEKVMAECGAGFDYIFETFPMKRAMELVFRGTGECSAIDWTLFGITIPQLSLVAFVFLAGYAIFLATLKK